MQAKFRQRPQGTGRDGAWFLEQLDEELDAYANRRRRRPDYLILATNVVLSPATDGFKDRVAARLQRAREEFGLRSWDIWDYDKLRVLLDNNESVRRSRAAWIMPGDVLHEVMSGTHLEDLDFETTLATFLQKELIGDQYVNLEQAGHAVEDKLPLGRVFTDLPIGPDPTSPAYPSRLDGPQRCLDLLLEIGAKGLRPLSDEEIERSGWDQGPFDRGRVVLVGGPGQGKSTVGQFLCQLHRTALLSERDSRTISPEAQQALESVKACARHEQLPLPLARRFPIRVPLNAYAAALAAPNGPRGLLDYLVQRLDERTGRAVTGAIFLRWLEVYPWLIVFDGLDEVPASSNRDAVLGSITDFWVDAAMAQSDVLVVATTRPQGYDGDFSPDLYLHLWLEALDAGQALRYGNRLAEQRYAGDPDRIAKVHERLERAAANDATRWLMQSPLQVTIMTALVDRMGHPPQERWSLFNEYYNVIYQREMERDIPAATILRDYRADIDAIHQRTALLLQVKSERAQQTEARLSHEQLAEVITRRLTEEGHDDRTVVELREQILEAAGLRLVFLVGLQHDRVGFEIRSLQEYMAAECLVDGPDAEVIERLTAVAGITSWRNVLLFAVGRCFATRQHLRDTAFRICTELNTSEDDPLARRCLAGSALAIDLLLDGPARRQPRYARLIGAEAARAFCGLPRPGLRRLAETHTSAVEQVYRDALVAGLADAEVANRLEGWRVLLTLEARGVPWAGEVVRACLPADPAALTPLLDCIELLDVAERSRRPLVDAAERLPLSRLKPIADSVAMLAHGGLPTWLDQILVRDSPTERLTGFILCPELLRNGMSFYLAPLDAVDRTIDEPNDLDHTWLPLAAAGRFAQEPTAQRLATELRLIADSADRPTWMDGLVNTIPWPLATCLAFARDARELRELADAAMAGRLGDRAGWLTAEERWRELGVRERDLQHVAGLADKPFDAYIASVGFPLRPASWSVGASADLAGATSLLRGVYATARAPGTRVMLAELLIALAQPPRLLLSKDTTWRGSLGEIAEWGAELQAGSRRWMSLVWIAELAGASDVADMEALLDTIGQRVDIASQEPSPQRGLEQFARQLGIHVRRDPGRTGLWKLLAHAVAQLGDHEATAVAVKLAPDVWPEDVVARAAAATVRMHAPIADEEVDVIVAAIVEAAKDHADLVRATLPKVGFGASGPAYERVVAEIDARLPREAVTLRLHVASLGDDALRRRTSPLFDRDAWNRLGLFERDERMLEPSLVA